MSAGVLYYGILFVTLFAFTFFAFALVYPFKNYATAVSYSQDAIETVFSKFRNVFAICRIISQLA